jgi:hypothetical protein
VELARGRGDQNVVDVGEIPAAGEGLAERGERERDGAADGLSERGDPHGVERVVGPTLGPPDRHEPVVVRTPLNLEDALFALVRRRPRPTTGLLPNATEQDGLPNRNLRKHPLKPLSREIRIRRPKIEVKNRLPHRPS